MYWKSKTDWNERTVARMNTEAMKAELAAMGIHSEADLKKAMANLSINISAMAAEPKKSRKAA